MTKEQVLRISQELDHIALIISDEEYDRAYFHMQQIKNICMEAMEGEKKNDE